MSFGAVRRFALFIAGSVVFTVVANVHFAFAQTQCPNNQTACPSNLGGACAPLGTICCPDGTYVSVGGTCANDKPGSYGAIAAIEYRTSSGAAEVAAAQSVGKTLSGASAAALYNCLQNSGGALCKIVGGFSDGGCGYVSVGHSPNGVRFWVSDTAQGAVDGCSVNGFTCKPAIGACTSK
jgi:hypothetical protein